MIRKRDIPAGNAFRLLNANVPGCLLEPASTEELLQINIDVTDDRIAAVQAAGKSTTALDGIDLDRSMVWPGLVDVHTHLDKGHIWPRTRESGRHVPGRPCGFRRRPPALLDGRGRRPAHGFLAALRVCPRHGGDPHPSQFRAAPGRHHLAGIPRHAAALGRQNPPATRLPHRP